MRRRCVGVSWNKIAGFPALFNPPHLKRVAVALPLPRRGCTFKWFVKNSVHLAVIVSSIFESCSKQWFQIWFYVIYRFPKLIFFLGAQIMQLKWHKKSLVWRFSFFFQKSSSCWRPRIMSLTIHTTLFIHFDFWYSKRKEKKITFIQTVWKLYKRLTNSKLWNKICTYW
jgi:hypothetical protein